MFVYLSKLLPQLIMPVSLAALLLFITLFLIRKHPKTALWLVLISLIWLGWVATPISLPTLPAL